MIEYCISCTYNRSIDRSIAFAESDIRYSPTSVTRKNRQRLVKLPKNDFTRKMIDFDTFTKIA